MTKINNTYYSDLVNWLLQTILLVLVFNFAGVLVALLFQKDITISRIVIVTALAMLFIIPAYLRHVDKIEFEDDQIIISKASKKYRDIRNNFQAIEKSKVTRTLHRYKRLIIKNKNIKKAFRIDSDNWKDYEAIKIHFFQNNTARNSNE